jgi:hypothetical protein
MANHCKKRNIEFMLVCCDVYFGPEVEDNYKKADPTFNPYFFEEDLKNAAESMGVAFLGLQGLFWESCVEKNIPCHWGKDGHWNYAGHKLVAEHLVRSLRPLIQNSSLPPTVSAARRH